ncbi:MAG TPA: glycosyltransferase family 9 protein [Aquihabitans sp.]|nr:glycosyltransferase family 9 protein [Aquihabitans sp.]
MTGHALVARLDNAGDVLLTGPTVRAVAASADRVTFLAGPAGRAAAELLPGVDQVLTWEAPWVGDGAPPVDPRSVEALVARLAALAVSDAVILTSFHQSPLPLALLLRMAGTARIAATSVDFPGTLLDHRLPYVESYHEVEQGLAVAGALGHHLPPGDDGRLATRPLPALDLPLPDRYVVVHPAASVPARSIPPVLAGEVVDALLADGHAVVVTGSAHDAAEAAPVPGGSAVVDLRGRTDLAALGRVLQGADVLVTGNTGPAHLAAAVGTPVAVAFAPVVAPHRWTPWGVPHVLLGDLDIACAGCRARTCPLPGQPCLDPVTPVAVVRAVRSLTRALAGPPVGDPALAGPALSEAGAT